MPLGPAQKYLCKYNTYVLPGYVQNESFDSIMNVSSSYATYADGANSQQTGLQNKMIKIRLKVWEQNFETCKTQIELAATYLRTNRAGFAPLYVQYDDRHYDAIPKTITLENVAGKNNRTQEYEVNMECRPWLIADATTTISGIGVIDTDQVLRTIDDGGWTPVKLTLTGTDITVSGYTDKDRFTGFVSISGAVNDFIIDSNAYTATQGGVNKNNTVKNIDYQVYVGPGKTYFDIQGATSCIIEWNNRWYI